MPTTPAEMGEKLTDVYEGVGSLIDLAKAMRSNYTALMVHAISLREQVALLTAQGVDPMFVGMLDTTIGRLQAEITRGSAFLTQAPADPASVDPLTVPQFVDHVPPSPPDS